ncbi:MAG TPA: protein-disulfide reductase DsbD [Gammaproteobacteria bacterium]|nr:protein-disulfide reductase DsbD [Gammaproteobacteria bacterium]
MLATVLMLFALTPLFAHADSEPLPPDQVFRLAAHAEDGMITLHWDILPDYYLYQARFKFISHTPGITLGKPQFPAGEKVHDKFFGDEVIYHHDVTVQIPYSGAGKLDLEAVYQGCNEKIGFCYPPQHKHVDLTLAAVGNASGVHPPDLATLVNGGDDADQSFPPPDQVFRFTASAKDANTIEVRWQIADGYYLYRQKFHFASSDPDIQLGAPGFPQGEIKNDNYFGTSEVYKHDVDALIPVTRSGDTTRFTLTASYQGCALKGFCYPPITKTVSLDMATPGVTSQVEAAPAPATASDGSQQDRLASLIRNGNLIWVFLAFIGLGLLLTFTPCVLPMIPIISGIIVGQSKQITTLRAFLLSLTYVLAMALTYTVAGVLVALLGSNVQAWFQNPWVLDVFALIFVLLALSMFGFYELQLPSALQTRLAERSNRARSGAFAGVAVMGVLSALIVGPCITAPLVAALIVIGESGEPVRGGLALFALGLGMGVPLLIIGTSAGKLVPKAGNWMNVVKAVFGVLMLAVAIWFLSRILPGPLTLLLWSGLAIVCGVYLSALDPLATNASGWRRLWKGLGVLTLLYGIILLIGAATGSDDPLRPLQHFNTPSGNTSVGVTSPVAQSGLQFTRIKSVDDLDRALSAAATAHKTAMLDFYADWCVSCKEMEHSAFMDPAVQAALADSVLLQADVTANDATDQALLKHFGIYGPPSIMFFGSDGQELRGMRVVGYMDAPQFAAHVDHAFGARE